MADPLPAKRVPILDTTMRYVETGKGDPIVFLHGNPTSSYVWRNIIPHLSSIGRCLAPDLVGMGGSGRSPTFSYRFVDHARYLDAWFDALRLTRNVTLVVHDWGSALGFHRFARFSKHFRAVAFLEAIVRPFQWSDFGEGGKVFQALRSTAGEKMIFEDNFFVEEMLPRGVIRSLNADEMEAYRAPFREREARLPTLVWPRQISIEGEPADVTEVVGAYGRHLAKSAIPKLLVRGDPGAIITLGDQSHEFCRSWRNLHETVVAGRHFLQEDSPAEIGKALREFLVGILR